MEFATLWKLGIAATATISSGIWFLAIELGIENDLWLSGGLVSAIFGIWLKVYFDSRATIALREKYRVDLEQTYTKVQKLEEKITTMTRENQLLRLRLVQEGLAIEQIEEFLKAQK